MDYQTAKKRLEDLRAKLRREREVRLCEATELVSNAVGEAVSSRKVKEYLSEIGCRIADSERAKKRPTNIDEIGEKDLDIDAILSLTIEENGKKGIAPNDYSNNVSLIREFQEKHDNRALDELVRANIGLVEKIAARYERFYRHSLDWSDLVQEGMMGVINAAKRFDASCGVSFSTYAVWWIRQSIVRAIYQKGFAVRLPVHLHTSISKMLNVERRLSMHTGTLDSSKVCAELGITLAKYYELKSYIYRFVELCSLDTPMPNDDSSELIDFVASGTHESVSSLGKEYIDVEAAVMTSLRDDVLRNVVEMLPEKEKLVIRLRYGLDDDQCRTLEEIGRILGVTRERVRQIEKRALEKLKHRLAGTQYYELMLSGE